MSIKGKQRENTENGDYVKKVGLQEMKVIAINPNESEYNSIIGKELAEDSKMLDYVSENKDGNQYLRVDFWLENIKSEEKNKITYFLEDKERENKDGTKKQYINNVGICTWAADENDLPDWFKTREYRVAKVGEEKFYNFVRKWLSGLDYKDADTVLELDWKKLMRGNIKDLKEQIDGDYCSNVVVLSTVISRERDGEVKEYSAIYSGDVLAPYQLKNFRLVDYHPKVVSGLQVKKPKDLKPHERFVVDIKGEYGCKDFYVLKDLRDYDPNDNLVASDKVIDDEDADY